MTAAVLAMVSGHLGRLAIGAEHTHQGTAGEPAGTRRPAPAEAAASVPEAAAPVGMTPETVLALQRRAGNAAVLRALARADGGRPLAAGVRGRLSSAFGGADLESVRVHTDPASAGVASRMGARAVAEGEHVAFAPGEYRPDTPVGDALIAHEVAHVLQQRGVGAGAGAEPAAAVERDADRSALAAVTRMVSRAGRWAAGVARDARPRLTAPLSLRACPTTTREEQRRLEGLAGELVALTDPESIADRLAGVERSTLDSAARVLRDAGDEHRSSMQARALEWELAWRDRAWSRLRALSDADADGLRVPYRRRIVAAVMAGSLTVRVSGGDGDWRAWVQARLEDLAERPVGFRVVVELLGARQPVTIRPPSGSERGGGHTTTRLGGPDDSAGRFDRTNDRAGTGAGSTVVLDRSVASNQVVIGGTVAAPTLIDADETVTVGHELIHALHNARGQNLSVGPGDVPLLMLGGDSAHVRDPLSGEPTDPEELWTIQGMTSFRRAKTGATQTFNVTATPSENDLRRERNLPLRQSHYGAQRDMLVPVSGATPLVDLIRSSYRFRAPNTRQGESAPPDAVKARILEVVRQMAVERGLPETIPAGLRRVPLPHPTSVVLRVRFIRPQPDLVDAASMLEARP